MYTDFALKWSKKGRGGVQFSRTTSYWAANNEKKTNRCVYCLVNTLLKILSEESIGVTMCTMMLVINFFQRSKSKCMFKCIKNKSYILCTGDIVTN